MPTMVYLEQATNAALEEWASPQDTKTDPIVRRILNVANGRIPQSETLVTADGSLRRAYRCFCCNRDYPFYHISLGMVCRICAPAIESSEPWKPISEVY